MKFSALLVAAVAGAAVITRQSDAPKPDKDGRYTISAEGIKAQVGPIPDSAPDFI